MCIRDRPRRWLNHQSRSRSKGKLVSSSADTVKADEASPATASPATTAGPTARRVAELSFFFPAHNEEANLEALVDEALGALPALAEKFEIIAVDDGSRDRTPAIADELAAKYPDTFRVVHHPTNHGYGAALRSGFRASRFELVAFIDGDRQFKVADVGRLTERMLQPDSP